VAASTGLPLQITRRFLTGIFALFDDMPIAHDQYTISHIRDDGVMRD
jgi:hypothetical protein